MSILNRLIPLKTIVDNDSVITFYKNKALFMEIQSKTHSFLFKVIDLMQFIHVLSGKTSIQDALKNNAITLLSDLDISLLPINYLPTEKPTKDDNVVAFSFKSPLSTNSLTKHHSIDFSCKPMKLLYVIDDDFYFSVGCNSVEILEMNRFSFFVSNVSTPMSKNRVNVTTVLYIDTKENHVFVEEIFKMIFDIHKQDLINKQLDLLKEIEQLSF